MFDGLFDFINPLNVFIDLMKFSLSYSFIDKRFPLPYDGD